MSTASLRGPSAEAAAQLEERLRASLGEVGTRKSGEVGQDLFGLARVVRTEPRLRRVLTDVSTAADAKRALVRQLFADKVDQLAADLAAEAAAARWTSPRDLADTLENLGVEATVRSAEDPGRVADELFAVERALNSSPELRNALGDPARSVGDKQEMVRGLLENRALAATVRLAEQAVAGSFRTASLALEAYQKVAAGVQGERVATVRSARELTDDEQRRLQAALSDQYDRAVHLNLVVQPELIGGLRIEIGDDVIDGTVAGRLDEARRRLAG